VREVGTPILMASVCAKAEAQPAIKAATLINEVVVSLMSAFSLSLFVQCMMLA
jgi:hypothetical protein